MNLYFVRHGNTFNSNEKPRQIGAKTDIPLTEKGIEQIRQLKKHFSTKNISFANYYCGSLKRQIQTAQILSDNDRVNIVHELDEIDYGLWENLTSDEIKNKFPTEYKKWNKQAIWPHNVFHGSDDACINALKNLIHNIPYSDTGNTLVVSSQGIIRYLLFLSGIWQNVAKNESMENYKVSPSNYCIIHKNNQNRINIIRWNCSIS
ncbi:MAG: histidine phosphatase family protein [Legionellales bacterium]|nr:histidine phosphatase family protein [Legionellales bacterium]